ncbi:uncharacterized protein [Medicago truncatula]|uniref:uncharacterized protein n=1 Tax=Medicago truncatula TaxID=3880 RepID=UPI000D2F1CBE|nr:uncharacterized protein LOC11416951 [Medicago truncatula]
MCSCAESIAPKSSLKRVVPEGSRAPSFGKKKEVHWADEKSDDVSVLVVGTKSWPALSDAQTPKPKNHVENVRPVASPRYQKPGPKRNVRSVAPPTHIAVPAYAFPPGSGPYPNGANPKPVSPVAAGQESMERRKRKSLAHHIDLNERASVQDPSERDRKKKRNGNDTVLIQYSIFLSL